MRGLRYLLPAMTLVGTLALWAGVASANSSSFSATINNAWSQDDNGNSNPNGNCSGSVGGSPSPAFGMGYPYGTNNDEYTQWAFGSWNAAVGVPAGATLTDASLSGSVSESAMNGYTAPAGSYGINVGAGAGSPWLSGRNSGCYYPLSYGMGDSFTASFPGNTSPVSFSGDAYNLAHTYVTDGSGDVYLATGDWQLPQGLWMAPASSMTLTVDYAFTPSGISIYQPLSGNGTQVTVSWNPNGNWGGTDYALQRETLNSGGVAVGWTTIYQGTATSFTTGDQTCGVGYAYRVQAVGAYASTPWDASSEWDEYPCSESFVGATTTSVTVSWPQVTPNTVPEIVWCEEGTPAGGVSCQQQRFDIGAGGTSATLTGLVPNAEYAVWACSATNAWGCPELNVWTYAAVPTLRANNNISGLAYDQQPLTWAANSNAPGTIYQLQQGTYAQSGAWQGGTIIYQGTGMSVTANQAAGTSYSYNVWAINAGYGTGSGASNGVAVQVASTPTLAITGPTTATVSWPAVAYMATTGVACNINGTANWFYPGPATGGATSLQVTGLQPNTQYYCVTYAITSNQGIQWWQGANVAYTDANGPIGVTVTGVTETTIDDSWNANGDPPGTLYRTYLEPASGGAGVDWQTTYNNTAIYNSLQCGVIYTPYVQAQSGNGQWTPWVAGPATVTVPCEPALSGSDGGLGWSPTSGRGYVTLSWPPSPGATGYTLYVWDGATYESFDLGDVTSWDSRQGLIYPADQSLYPNVPEASKSPPVFAHSGGGLNLRDLPLDLYCTTGTYYCTTSSAQNYWFTVAAYNASGSSASFQVPGQSASSYYQPTLPLQTDPNAPVVTNFTLNNGGAYTYSSTVAYSLSAAEGTSGIAAYALSNDGTTWTTTVFSGCTVGQIAPCQGSLSTSGMWTLLPGPGSKTVWVKVESAAGVWSAPMATTVYVNVDQTTPTVNVTLNGGATSTTSTSVTVGVSVTDTVAQETSLTWQVRYSTDGGVTWSAWQTEGASMSWSTPWTIPGGQSGPRSVYVQVENNDQNLGQGAGSILFVNQTQGSGTPSLSTPGTTKACTWQVDGSPVSATCVTSSQVSVPLTVPAGATQMRASLDDVTWGPWLGAASSLSTDLGASPGAKTVWIQFQDAQGNVTDAGPLWYVFDPGAPTLSASWLGNASATDSTGAATLNLQASDDVGQPNQLTVTVTENGGQVYSGPFGDSLPVTLTGTGYQIVQVAVTNLTGATTTERLGIYVE